MAEAIYGRTDGEPPPEGSNAPNQARHALFLARRGRIKDAVDLCEGLWAEPKTRLTAADVSIRIACDPAIPLDESQVRRIVGHYQRAIAEDQQSMILTIGLGNILERLGDYDGAEAMYRKAIRINDSDGIASNNLAWLMALKGGRGPEALDLIDKAITVKGPLPEYLDTRGMIYLGAGERQRSCRRSRGGPPRRPDTVQVFPPCPGLSSAQRQGEGPQGTRGRQVPRAAQRSP